MEREKAARPGAQDDVMLYPLTFRPILKPRVWGGRRLSELGKPVPDAEDASDSADIAIGESWEIADLPDEITDGQSVIANGPLAGHRLHDTMVTAEAMGDARRIANRFPLLIKYLDARTNLSVQVHPTRTYADAHPGAHLKSEAWIVVRADPGAVIYKGLRPGITAEEFRSAIEAGTLVDDLIAIPASVGDCHYLPSGTCHALGAGLLVAEVQTPSDTTFRVWDWGRTGRELHIEQAMACINFGAAPSSMKPTVTRAASVATTRLVETEFFAIERIETVERTRFEEVTNNIPVIWMILTGTGIVEGNGEAVELSPGTTVLFPADLRNIHARVAADTTWLRVTPAHPSHGGLS